MSSSSENDTVELQRFLYRLAARFDEQLAVRYRISRPPRPKGLYWRLRWLAGSILRRLQAMGVLAYEPWPVGLKRQPFDARSKPLLIWAVGASRDSIRQACNALSDRWDYRCGFAPVLITDVADFAFFSRLGWLIEYLPRLTGQGEVYDEQKMKYLAHLYCGAPAIPVSEVLKPNWPEDGIEQCLIQHQEG